MGYITYSDFASIYGTEVMTEAEFNRFQFDAERIADILTTGADNVRKLAVAMPTDAHDREIVTRAIANLVNVMCEVEKMETAAVHRGIEMGGGVSSVSSGSESISYGGNGSAIAAASVDPAAKKALYAATLTDYFRGVTDKNGVNLLYMGRYPCVP